MRVVWLFRSLYLVSLQSRGWECFYFKGLKVIDRLLCRHFILFMFVKNLIIKEEMSRVSLGRCERWVIEIPSTSFCWHHVHIPLAFFTHTFGPKVKHRKNISRFSIYLPKHKRFFTFFAIFRTHTNANNILPASKQRNKLKLSEEDGKGKAFYEGI